MIKHDEESYFFRFFSHLVVVKQGKMVKILKQNGHPVSLKGISFICKEKQYPKEKYSGTPMTLWVLILFLVFCGDRRHIFSLVY